MDLSTSSTRPEALLVFDASTFNPFKNLKTSKPRLKAKTSRQLKDQPKILQLLSRLQDGKGFSVSQFIPLALRPWGRADDEQVLNELEKLAGDYPQCVVIFITRDCGFCYASGWHPEQSRIFICILPRVYFSKSISQYSRLDMMYIIAIDVTSFFTKGNVMYSQLYSPERVH